MSTYNIHAGHGITGGTGCGAVGILDESLEARKVKDALINYLKMEHTVYDCTYNGSASASAILESIVAMCNAHDVDLDISIHLNSGRSDYNGDDSTGGVEVLGYDNETKEIGEAICINIANALGIRNRGFKINQSLYVLRKTKSPALLIECCFVDDKDDADVWNADKCAKAIFKALTGKEVSEKKEDKYKVGQYVTFTSSYPTPTSPCGIKYATAGSGKGKITAIVNGQAKYQIDNSARYCNDGDISGTYTPQTSTTPTPTTSTPSLKKLNVNAYYKVFAGGKWYSEVKNLEDYAGDAKNAIRAIAIKVDNGSVKYRVHVRGGNWYPYVTGYNTSDGNNGYAGDGRNDIDAIEVYYTTPSGYEYKKAKYRIAPIGKDYYSWQTDNDKNDSMDGYAGSFGKSFGKFQLTIE